MGQTRVAVSNTHELAGWKIEAHLDVVTAHVVAGTGLFSDLAASVSDLVGGRSRSYQNQLSDISREAIELLRTAAKDIGGDGIVGVRLDFSDISGKGKAMLMVSATGTAVRATIESEVARTAAQSIGGYSPDPTESEWRCRCGRINSVDEKTCPNCGRVPGAIY